MRTFFLFVFPLLLVGFFFIAQTKPTCAYSINSCAGNATDGEFYGKDKTICYYPSGDDTGPTSDAGNVCTLHCPDLPLEKTCDDLIREDPNRNHTEHAIEVIDTSVKNGQNCDVGINKGLPVMCCAIVPTLPTNVKGTVKNPCPEGTCDTALGPININDPQKFVTSLFSILLSISGIVALLLIVTAGYQLSLSQGNPEKIKAARERLVSAIIGLLFIIFSGAILEIIGWDILRIPGFGK